MTEDEMVGVNHRLNGHEFEQTPGDGGGQRSMDSSWGCKESDTTQQLNTTNTTSSVSPACQQALVVLIPCLVFLHTTDY